MKNEIHENCHSTNYNIITVLKNTQSLSCINQLVDRYDNYDIQPYKNAHTNLIKTGYSYSILSILFRPFVFLALKDF